MPEGRHHNSFHVPVAQLDRASASEAEGYRFDPCRGYFSISPPTRRKVMRKPDHHSAGLVTLLAIGLILTAPAVINAADPGVALRERYLGPTGLPTETAYAHSHGILPAPGTETFDWHAVFKLTYRTADLPRLNDARAVHTDCYFVHSRKYVAPSRIQPVWDGRAFAVDNRLVVAAYTPKGERVVGQIDEQSSVVLNKNTDKPIASPDLGGVQYNPFTGQLLAPLCRR